METSAGFVEAAEVGAGSQRIEGATGRFGQAHQIGFGQRSDREWRHWIASSLRSDRSVTRWVRPLTSRRGRRAPTSLADAGHVDGDRAFDRPGAVAGDGAAVGTVNGHSFRCIAGQTNVLAVGAEMESGHTPVSATPQLA